MNDSKDPLSYEGAGVSIERGNRLVERIKGYAASTHDRAVLSGLGGFGALYDFSQAGYREPVLVSGTDGVGTKIKLAIEANRHSTIGIDLVAMCVNDLLVQGAKPLFFLDYYACSHLNVATAGDVISGIAEGCQQAGCALVGGETAEMPGMYAESDYDLAGFCVGVVEKSGLIDGSAIREGDAVIALASSGPHSNGYSLIRKILEVNHIPLHQQLDDKPLVDHLLEPTRIYVKPLLELMQQVRVPGLAHITGGGLIENIPRILPAGLGADIDRGQRPLPAIFQWLQEQGRIRQEEMVRTFNCGIGMVLIVPAQDRDATLGILDELGVDAWHAGEITRVTDNEPRVRLL